jgi:hypothetical protein
VTLCSSSLRSKGSHHPAPAAGRSYGSQGGADRARWRCSGACADLRRQQVFDRPLQRCWEPVSFPGGRIAATAMRRLAVLLADTTLFTPPIATADAILNGQIEAAQRARRGISLFLAMCDVYVTHVIS